MKRQILVNGLLSLTVVSCLTGCVDDKYDLSDIDTTSRFTVKDLTVPVNLSEIKLKNVVNLDDNDLIEKIIIDGKESYSIVQKGDIAPTEFSIGEVNVAAPHIDPTSINVAVPQIPNVPGMQIPEFDIELPASDMKPYDFRMDNVNEALKVLKNVKTVDPITIAVELSVPSELLGGNNRMTFENLQLQLPSDLITNDEHYETSGLLKVPTIDVNSEGKAYLSLTASGLELGEKGKVENGQLSVAGTVGILGGNLKVNVSNVTLPSSLDITARYTVSGFKLASFSGKIDYNMDAIHIDPISLNDLPDFLDSPETNLIIANPQILVSIKNPVGKWLNGKGRIVLKSNFKNGQAVDYPSDEFTLTGNESDFAFCTPKTDYTYVKFDGLGHVLSNGQAGLPSSIEVNIDDINFAGDVEDFPLGDLGSAEGNYEFNAPLGFGNGSIVVYETTEADWGSEDLEKVCVNKIHLNAKCTTNLPVAIKLSVVPVDKNGKEIAVKENSGLFDVPAMADNKDIALLIESINGSPITNFDGVKFKAIVSQDSGNTEAIGPDLQILLKDLKVTVDGYYETDF